MEKQEQVAQETENALVIDCSQDAEVQAVIATREKLKNPRPKGGRPKVISVTDALRHILAKGTPSGAVRMANHLYTVSKRNDRVGLDAANIILDRVEGKPVQSHAVVTAQVDPADAKLLAEAYRKLVLEGQ